MRVQVMSFAVMALLPLALCLMAALSGGLWVWAAVVWLGVVVAALDLILPPFAANAPEGAEFPGSDALLAVIGISVPVLLAPVVVAAGLALSGPGVTLMSYGSGTGEPGICAAQPESLHSWTWNVPW